MGGPADAKNLLMKTLPLIAVLVFVVSLQQATAQPLPTPPEAMKREAQVMSSPPPVVVEGETARVRRQIREKALGLLKAADYQALDAFAEELRHSAEAFANGNWPVTYFFSEVGDLPDEATPAEWEAHMQALRQWFAGDVESISARVALARALVGYAWQARGDSWAREVTSDGWRLMEERITEARRILIAAETLPHHCPAFYSTRLKVALGDHVSREEYDRLFSEGVTAFPNYPILYILRATYLLPRWFGREGDWEDFARESADRVGGQQGDVLYAQIVWAMHDARLFGNIFKETKVEWSRTQSGFEGLCTRYPQSVSALSEYCYLAGQSPQGGRGLTRTLFPRLGNRVDLSVWRTKERWTQDRAWAFSSN